MHLHYVLLSALLMHGVHEGVITSILFHAYVCMGYLKHKVQCYADDA